MNIKKKEGGFYASKVRQYLNEYSGIDLMDFCRAERVSYSKMCNCLGLSPYSKSSGSRRQDSLPEASPMLPELELAPLVVDVPSYCDCGSAASRSSKDVYDRPSTGADGRGLLDIRIQTPGGTNVFVSGCSVGSFVRIIRELEARPC